MRLLVLTSSYPTATNPGGGVFIQRMLERLPEQLQITVLTPDTQAAVPNEPPDPRIRLRRFRYAPRRLQVLANQFGGIPAAVAARPWLLLLLPAWAIAMFGAALMLSRKADVIHAHWSVGGVIGGLAGWVTGTPVVTTLHGTDVAWAERFWPLRWSVALCFHLSARIVTVSAAMDHSLRGRYARLAHKIQMVANGVGHEFWDIPNRQPRSDSDQFIFTVIGSLIPSKQVDHAVLALKRLIDAGRFAQLRIAGQGPSAPELKSLVHRLALNEHVEFCGALAPGQVADLLANVDALVLASAREGRPTVVMEAMAAGVPVIAGKIDGVKELIEDGQRGLLYDPGDIQHLSDQLAALCHQPHLAHAVATKARHWIRGQGLTWDDTAAGYSRIYSHLMTCNSKER